MSEEIDEGVASFQHGLMEGATTQPFTSIADEYQKTATPPRRANYDLSQKYRKVNPTCTAPVMKVQQKRRRQDMTRTSEEVEVSSWEAYKTHHRTHISLSSALIIRWTSTYLCGGAEKKRRIPSGNALSTIADAAVWNLAQLWTIGAYVRRGQDTQSQRQH